MPVQEAPLGFVEFWNAYPRRVGKKAALKAWEKIHPDFDLAAQIVAAIHLQALADRELRFIPHPATWLNGERWTDEPERRGGAVAPGLNGATWRDTCPHRPTCQTPTLCQLKQVREASAWP